MVNHATKLQGLMTGVVFTAFSAVAVAAPCDAEENRWIPGRYYPPGSTVFHQSEWYESRQLHEGKTPGVDFEWKKRASAPECRKKESPSRGENGGQGGPQQTQARTQERQAPQASQAPTAPAAKARKNARQACNDPAPWSFGISYTVGQMAIYQGQTYRAIRPSNGQMPGMSKPPHWQPVDPPCTNAADSGD